MPGPYLFGQTPALSPDMVSPQNGALSSFMSPQGIGLMSLAAGLLRAGGPSRFPVSTGQAIGQGIQSGIAGYQGAANAQNANALRQAQINVYQQKAAQDRQRAALMQQALGNGASGPTNPDQLEAIGRALAASGDPGGATFITQAQKLRQQLADRQAVEGFRSRPGSLGALVTPQSPQGQALVSNMTGDPEWDKAVISAQADALNSNPNVTPQPVSAPYPGVMGPLIKSPYVGPQAQELQRQINTNPSLTSAQILSQFDRLQQQNQTATNQATARQENQDFRREMANQTDRRLREMRAAVTGNLQEQRTFGKESKLAQQYNSLSSDFRKAEPAFNAAADYMAKGEYNSSGDRALVFQYQKMLDPQDRVAVYDLRDIAKLGSLPERFTQYIVQLAEGKELPDRIRNEMYREMARRFGTANETQMELEDEYRKRAQRYMLNPDNVVIQYSARQAAGKKPASGGNQSGAPRVVDFNSLPRSR